MKLKILNVLTTVFGGITLFNYTVYICQAIFSKAKAWNIAVAAAVLICVSVPMVLLAVFGNKARQHKKRLIDVLQTVFVCGLGVYVISFSVFCVWLLQGLNRTSDTGYDAVIVFGGGIQVDVISDQALSRLDSAAEHLKKDKNAVCIVSGGKAEGNPYSEAYLMKLYLTGLKDIEEDRVIMEDQSKNTWDNIKYSYELIEKGSKVLCISSDYHVKRIDMMLKRQGFDADILACDIPFSLKEYSSLVREYMAYVKFFVGLNDI